MTEEPEKPPHISQQDWDDADLPEWTEANFDRAVSFGTAHPEAYAAWKGVRAKPSDAPKKVMMGFRLAADLAARIKASGKGYNARVEKLLRDAINDGTL